MTATFHLLFVAMFIPTGCAAPRKVEVPTGPHFKVLTFNVNWGVPRSKQTIDAIRKADADIVCLQESNRQWERLMRWHLARQYPFQEYRQSKGRLGGGLAFLSKRKGVLRAYARSKTGWFDGWVMEFPTTVGPVQVLNVHLQPQVDENDQYSLDGFLSANRRHEKEIKRFHFQFDSDKNAPPLIVAGDFNEGESGGAVTYLAKQGFTNALPEFDCRTRTWAWDFGLITWRMRLDHLMYQRLHCFEAKVIKAGGSDHLPVLAVFGRSKKN